MSGDASRRDSWSRYWAAGALHSCGTSFDGNYAGEIAEFWRAELTGLGAADRILDVATGNGALPRLIVDCVPELPEVDAIDLADVAPRWPRALPKAQRARLHFHARVAAEALPFADAHFALVVSQYGIEYSDLARSLPELRRVLRPEGRIALVVHHADSLPVRLGGAEATHIEWLLAEGQLVDSARRLLPYLARLATPAGMAAVQRDPLAAAARTAFNLAMRALEDRCVGALAPDVLAETQQALGQLAQQAARIGERQTMQRWLTVEQGLQQALLRQRELVAHAQSAAAVHRLMATLLAGVRGEQRVCELRERGEIFGWGLSIRYAG